MWKMVAEENKNYPYLQHLGWWDPQWRSMGQCAWPGELQSIMTDISKFIHTNRGHAYLM